MSGKASRCIPPDLLIKLAFTSDTPDVEYWLKLFSKFREDAYFNLVKMIIICHLNRGNCGDCCKKEVCSLTYENVDFGDLSSRWGDLLGSHYGFACNACPKDCSFQPKPESKSGPHIFRNPQKSDRCTECGELTKWWMREKAKEFWICPRCIYQSKLR